MVKFWYEWGSMLAAFILGLLCLNLAQGNIELGWFSPTLINFIGYISFTFAIAMLVVKPFEYLDALLQGTKK
jgi:hypothetical protein